MSIIRYFTWQWKKYNFSDADIIEAYHFLLRAVNQKDFKTKEKSLYKIGKYNIIRLVKELVRRDLISEL
jgi:hypothetical protein